jgi:DNA-binding MarR family transcriptional regulator
MRRFDQIYDAELARAGLKTTQYSLLSHVVRLAPVRPGVLARAMDLQPSTLTRNLQPLVAAGWVEIGAGSDARSRVVSATAAGIAKRTQAQRHWKSAQLRINALLGVSQVAALHTLLDSAMQTLDADPVQDPSTDGHG